MGETVEKARDLTVAATQVLENPIQNAQRQRDEPQQKDDDQAQPDFPLGIPALLVLGFFVHATARTLVDKQELITPEQRARHARPGPQQLLLRRKPARA